LFFTSREQCLLNVAGYAMRAAIKLALPGWFDQCWSLARAVCVRDWREPLSLNNVYAKVMLKPLDFLKIQADVLMPCCCADRRRYTCRLREQHEPIDGPARSLRGSRS
jgi:hypothetical protein